MATVLKAEAEAQLGVASVRPMARVRAPLEVAPDREAELRGEIFELEARLLAAEKAHVVALEKAREGASQEALQQRSDAEVDQLQALEKALGQAQSELQQNLESIQCVAIHLAKRVLEKLFVGADDRTRLVVDCLERQVAALGAQSILKIRVSPQDLDTSTADALAQSFTDFVGQVELDPALKSGECHFDLKLGHASVGPQAQWREVCTFLDKMIEQEAHW